MDTVGLGCSFGLQWLDLQHFWHAFCNGFSLWKSEGRFTQGKQQSQQHIKRPEMYLVCINVNHTYVGMKAELS